MLDTEIAALKQQIHDHIDVYSDQKAPSGNALQASAYRRAA
ncbi:MAG: hypothetical protein ABI648_16620 [Betaproteobacteria bacterium]|jgi:hypothetical protein